MIKQNAINVNVFLRYSVTSYKNDDVAQLGMQDLFGREVFIGRNFSITCGMT